ncbi:MAG: FliM/FliN family flagellar motor switch protein [Pseudomonadota bacterium]
MTVLKRMLKPAQGGGGPVREVWTKVVPKVSDKLAGLVAAVSEVSEGQTTLDEIVEGWDEKALYLVLSQGSGPDGFAIVDPVLLTGVIEILTTGSIGTGEVSGRPPTAVDAALAAHVVNAWVYAVEAEAGTSKGLRASGPPVPEARTASLTYAPGVYRELAVTVDLAEGSRLGTVRLLVPEAAAVEVMPDDAGTKRGAVHAVEVKLEVVLCQKTVSLEWIRGLTPGTTLKLPISALGDARLRAKDGRPVARGRLGQKNGMKALRIADEPPQMEVSGGLDDSLLGAPLAQEALLTADGDDGFPAMGADAETGFPAMEALPSDDPDEGFPAMEGDADGFPAMDALPAGDDEEFPAMAPMDMSDLEAGS